VIAPSASLALATSDELIGELARRGTLVLHVDNVSAPAGIALEDVERARRALPLEDRSDDYRDERNELDIATPGAVQGHLDYCKTPSWLALLYRAFVEVAWAPPAERRQALVDLAALAVRWVEALDAREPEPAEGGDR
jgi:hypothetical protein